MFKKNLDKNIYVIIVLSLIIGCVADVSIEKSEQSNKSILVDNTNVNLNLYYMIANNYLNLSKESEDNWKSAEISGNFIWYNPMVKGPAYIEYKVTANGEDAGYIIVSTTDLDYPIPQYHTSGKALYEILAERLNTIPENIKGIRFDDFSYMGELKNLSRSSTGGKKFLGVNEYLNNQSDSVKVKNEFDNYLTNYINFRKELKAIGDKKVYIEEYYRNREKIEQEGLSVMRSMTMRGSKPKPPYSASFSTTISYKNSYLPKYQQYELIQNGVSVDSGCTPTAATMIMAYWELRFGKKFFHSTPSLTWDPTDNAINMGNEKGVVKAFRDYMKTNGGSTYSWDSYWGIVYFLNDKRYYHNIRFYEWVAGSGGGSLIIPENSQLDWNNIHNDIAKNYPAILNYNASGGHSAVIYRSKIWRNEWTGIWHTVEYSVHTGWSSPDETVVNSNKKFLFNVICIEIGNKY